MAKTWIGSSKDFLMARLTPLHARAHLYKGPKTHSYKAAWVEGRGLVVTDSAEQEVALRASGTLDNRTVMIEVEGVGYIGGWQYPHRAMPWRYLVESINRGVLYQCADALPRKYPKTVVCPHCGGEVSIW